eukprot:TRINITY_DN3455_c1_g2_i1.p1 TRINITY_DN3455_c1_g2~~TRINITY_DN3455_c1_g2_i1.p1  ORF type:complete len:115 (-),score=34.41 TRINITY_DN3455_c1_g2_i1:47-391(-)
MPLTVDDSEKSELMVTYAALILADDKAPVTADNLDKIVKAAGGKIEPFWPKLFAQMLEGRDVIDLLSAGGGGGPAVGGAAAGGDAPAEDKKEEKKVVEESDDESDDGDGFGLFD